MRTIAEKTFLENTSKLLERAATMQQSFMVETKNGNVALIPEQLFVAYEKIAKATIEGVQVILAQEHNDQPF